MSAERRYIEQLSKKRGITRWLPALGFLMALALAGVAYVLSEPVHEMVYDSLSSQQGEVDKETVRYGVMFLLFVLFLAVAGMLYALFAPKPKYKVTEKDLAKERAQNELQRRKEKERKHRLNKQVAAERERKLKEEAGKESRTKRRS
jgi:uncharacterized iron-regulated membrane protein